ncbi:MAG: DUF4838 domain-containing protein [Armatimonadota bacterium]|nr:DUF4838 domain-containing protein [Armatimonadota bacterium]
MARIVPNVIIAHLLILASITAGAAGNVAIVENGQPKATIVVSAQENAKVKVAAADLQAYIRKMSGAMPPIVTDAENPKGSLILVGKSRLTDEMKVSIPSGLTNARREEGFTIVCKGDRIALAGNDAGPYHGTEFAVYDFLNRLGVRWYMPGEWGEYVPQKQSIAFAEVSIKQKPDFVVRSWWCHAPQDLHEQEDRWKIRNKMNEAPEPMTAQVVDGSARSIMPEGLFEKRPELFAMNQDGTRNADLANLTNPETVKVAAEVIKDFFRKNPDACSYGFAPNDGLPRDYSPETVKLSRGFVVDGGRPGVPDCASITEEWIGFVNNLTAEVRKEFPDAYLATNGYANRNFAPQGVNLDDHLIIMFANIMCCSRHPYDDPKCWMKNREAAMLRQWCKRSPNVWMYNYIDQMLVSALTPIPEVHKLRRDIPLCKKWGVMGFRDEARKVLAECGILSRYLRAQLEWNAGADVDAILDDYYSHWYGGAAKPMRAFYEAIETAFDVAPIHGHEDRILPEVYTPKMMAELAKNLALGEKLADTERAKLHVRVDRLIYEHLQTYLAMTNAEFECRFADAAKEAAHMMQLRGKMHEINPFLIEPDEKDYVSGVCYWTVTQRQKYYESLADLTSGKTGTLVAVLPEKAMFRTDPKDDGLLAEWYDPGFPLSGWKPIKTTRPFYVQGYQDKQCYPYLGYMWYRFDIDFPASAIGKKIMLYSPALETEGWVWVNGQYVGHRPYTDAYIRPNAMEFGVGSTLRPGKNTIAIRVSTSPGAAQEASGLLSRVFLYEPMGKF